MNMVKDSKYGAERFVSVRYPDWATDMDRFIESCNMEADRLQVKGLDPAERLTKRQEGWLKWKALNRVEYTPGQRKAKRQLKLQQQHLSDARGSAVSNERGAAGTNPQKAPSRLVQDGSLACGLGVLQRRMYGPNPCTH